MLLKGTSVFGKDGIADSPNEREKKGKKTS
jgi:hypothetical protein